MRKWKADLERLEAMPDEVILEMANGLNGVSEVLRVLGVNGRAFEEWLSKDDRRLKWCEHKMKSLWGTDGGTTKD